MDKKEIKIVEPNIGKWLKDISHGSWSYKDEVIRGFKDIERYSRYFATNLETNEDMIHVNYLVEKIEYIKRRLENIEIICIDGQETKGEQNG